MRTRTSPAMVALARKKAELMGEADELRRRLRKKQIQIAALDESMRLLDQGYDPEAIKPKRKYTKTFIHGELKRMIFDILKETDGGPLTTRQIADEVQKRKGVDRDVRKDVKRALQGYRIVVKVGEIENHQALWAFKDYAATPSDTPPPLRIL